MAEEKEMTPSLVMRRFFTALKNENLMAAELLATHDLFDGGDVDYGRTFGKMLNEHPLTMPTIEWLLTFAKGSNRGFWNPAGEYNGYGRRSGNNWRGHICDKVRLWMRHAAGMNDEQRRIARLTYELKWQDPSFEFLDSESGREWLQQIVKPARLLEMALSERGYYEGGKHMTKPLCLPMIERLIEQGPVDISQSGEELVREYQRDAGRALVVRIIAHRDTSKPMPKAFTSFVQDVLEKYKMYQHLSRDLSTLLKAKTNE
jgi:hypothetical protein